MQATSSGCKRKYPPVAQSHSGKDRCDLALRRRWNAIHHRRRRTFPRRSCGQTPRPRLHPVTHTLPKKPRQTQSAEISTILNQRGLRTRVGNSFGPVRIMKIQQQYGPKGRYDLLREAGCLTAEELPRHWGVTPRTVAERRKLGQLKAARLNDRPEYLHEPPAKRRAQAYVRWSALTAGRGSYAIILNSVAAGPVGRRRSCSQFCRVFTLTPIQRANSDCERLVRSRIARISEDPTSKRREAFLCPRRIALPSRTLSSSSSNIFGFIPELLFPYLGHLRHLLRGQIG